MIQSNEEFRVMSKFGTYNLRFNSEFQLEIRSYLPLLVHLGLTPDFDRLFSW
jgi:hypothetical protein